MMLPGASALCPPSDCATWSGGPSGFFLILTLRGLKFNFTNHLLKEARKLFSCFVSLIPFVLFHTFFSFTLDKNNT